MATTTPVWSDNVSVIASTTVARGATSRATIDLRTKRGADIFVFIGRGGTSAISGGNIIALFRRTLNNAGIIAPAPSQIFFSDTTAANGTTCSGSDSNAGQNELKTASVAGFSPGDIICIQDSGGGTTRLEWARIAKTTVGSGTGVTLDAPLQFTHTAAGADTVRNHSNVWLGWIDGGATYEIIIDYAAPSGGETATIRVLAQTYDSESTT